MTVQCQALYHIPWCTLINIALFISVQCSFYALNIELRHYMVNFWSESPMHISDEANTTVKLYFNNLCHTYPFLSTILLKGSMEKYKHLTDYDKYVIMCVTNN